MQFGMIMEEGDQFQSYIDSSGNEIYVVVVMVFEEVGDDWCEERFNID